MLSAVVYLALAAVAASPFILLYLLVKDIKEGKLW
jgi:hypothetical protein